MLTRFTPIALVLAGCGSPPDFQFGSANPGVNLGLHSDAGVNLDLHSDAGTNSPNCLDESSTYDAGDVPEPSACPTVSTAIQPALAPPALEPPLGGAGGSAITLPVIPGSGGSGGSSSEVEPPPPFPPPPPPPVVEPTPPPPPPLYCDNGVTPSIYNGCNCDPGDDSDTSVACQAVPNGGGRCDPQVPECFVHCNGGYLRKYRYKGAQFTPWECIPIANCVAPFVQSGTDCVCSQTNCG